MVQNISIEQFPNNDKVRLYRLISFASDVISTLKKNSINTILYGSLAYFHYTGDRSETVNDIDLYLEEKDIRKAYVILRESIADATIFYSRRYHTIQIKKKGMIVELDSIDFWFRETQKDDKVKVKIDGTETYMLSSKSLAEIYLKASQESSKKEKNEKKYRTLQSGIGDKAT